MKIFVFIFFALLSSCSGGGGGSPAASPAIPEVDEQSVTSTVACHKALGSLDFYFVITTFNNNDKYITCTLSNSTTQVQSSWYYKSTFAGATSEDCLVSFDSDGTASYGYWQFSRASGVRKVVYNDSSSGSNGTTVTYAPSDCITATK